MNRPDRSQFLLDPDVVYLNHGSFGACPRVVFQRYQDWQHQLERQPMQFLVRRLPELLASSRQRLAEFVGAETDELVYVANPTFAVNEIAKSLQLEPDAEVLTSDHEYGACLNAWNFMAQRQGFRVVQQPIPVPCASAEQILEAFWSGVTERTRVIFLSQITSPTAMILPVTEICRRAREQGILTLIDGAHAPGQIPLDLQDLDADFYVATCHKWLCAPKGAAFLFARRPVQHLLQPLVVGWGWGDEHRQFDSGNDFVDMHCWLGTDDPAAYLTVPAALDFQVEHNWGDVRGACHDEVVTTINRLAELPGVEKLYGPELHGQMGVVQLPLPGTKSAAAELQSRLLADHRIEIPCFCWQDRLLLRVSIQSYNTTSDVDALVAAVRANV